MKRRTRRLALSALLAALTLCFVGCGARKKPSSVEAAFAHATLDVVIPIEARGLKNPIPRSEAAVKDGQKVYMQHCALCHGAVCHGNTTLGRDMYPPAMDLTSPYVQHWNDAELYWIIQNGVRLTGMPGWKSVISSDDSWKLAQFIHTLPKITAQTKAPPAPPPGGKGSLIAYGKTLFRQEGCFSCHRLNGKGGKVGPDLTKEGTRGRSDAWLIGHFKDPPAYSPGSTMPSFKNLTNQQLQALTAFLQSEKGK
jgi:mono/diheme cytochrome c family protein